MADTTTRTKSEPIQDSSPPSGVPTTSGAEVTIEVPYRDYQDNNGRPFVADHYQLGDTWYEPNGGFPNEVAAIEDYVENQIKRGEIANTQGDVKTLLKRLEKITNVDKESRSLVKVETIAAYVEFLRKTDTLKGNIRKYGSA